jgi:hypothetical protein
VAIDDALPFNCHEEHAADDQGRTDALLGMLTVLCHGNLGRKGGYEIVTRCDINSGPANNGDVALYSSKRTIFQGI